MQRNGLIKFNSYFKTDNQLTSYLKEDFFLFNLYLHISLTPTISMLQTFAVVENIFF